jgi:hypothetical protein
MTTSRGKAAKWILLGCGGILLLSLLTFGGCLVLIMGATKPAVEASERFLTAVSSGDLAAAKGTCDAEVGAKLEEFVKATPNVWGKTWSVTGREVSVNNGVKTAVVKVNVTGTDGNARALRISLRDDNPWKVIGVHFDGDPGLSGAAEAPESSGKLRISDVETKKARTEDGKWIKVSVSLKVFGLKQERVDGESVIRFQQGYAVIGPDGREKDRNDDFQKFKGAGDTGTVQVTVPIGTASPAGKYALVITVKDLVAGGPGVEERVEFEIP